MSDEVSADVIKRTQKLLGSYFTKPPLTDKLLRKPPFRFLHDIISSLIKETGFLKGLFSEDELNSNNIKDKTAKINFLTKLIAVVELATGTRLSVKPNKIVAGLEPTKTNELLHTIGKAVRQKVDCTEAIKKYNAGTTGAKTKPSTTTLKPKVTKKPSPHGSTENIQKSTEHGTSKTKSTKPKSRQSENHTKVKKAVKESREPSENVDQTNIEADIPTEIQDDKITNVKRTPTIESQEETVTNDNKELEAMKNGRLDNNVKTNNSTDTAKNSNKENEIKTTEVKEKKESENKIITKTGSAREDFAKLNEADLKNPSRIAFSPVKSAAPIRPSSARPAAPRIQPKPNITFQENKTLLEKNFTIFNEKNNAKFDDDDINDVIIVNEPNHIKTVHAPELQQEHGHLVAQILETQKDLVDSAEFNPMTSTFKTKTEIIKSDNDATGKEIEKLRISIQQLTRASNPLGKLTDFIQENIEIMQKEYSLWTSQNKNLKKYLDTRKMVAEKSVEHIKQMLNDNDTQIKEETFRIQQLKIDIAKNNEKISKLINKCI